jgi:hypothetical protein
MAKDIITNQVPLLFKMPSNEKPVAYVRGHVPSAFSVWMGRPIGNVCMYVCMIGLNPTPPFIFLSSSTRGGAGIRPMKIEMVEY